MKLNEKYKQAPIKFYRNPDGTIYYEASFINGTAKNLDDAFNVFAKTDWENDLIYYYTDVIGVEFGAFEPAYKDIQRKGRTYLGKINLKLDIDPNWGTDEKSITHLSKHPEDIPKQLKYVQKMKFLDKKDKFLQNLKSGLKRVAGFLTGQQYEMFDPIKTRQDLICDYCGEIIPVSTYYEYYQNKNYHLECIWDKLCNETPSNNYEDCREFFFGLQQYLDNWPSVGYDIQYDYEIDLDLVKTNDRKTGLNEEAAMYKSNQPTFEDFYNYVIKNPKAKKSYFEITKPYKLRIPSDKILHDYKKHGINYDNWNDCLSNLNNIMEASISKTKIASSPAKVALCRILGKNDYGISIQLEKTYNQITTIFMDHPNTIDNWIKTGAAGGSASQLQTSDTSKSSSVTQSSQTPNNIIAYIKEKIKG